MKVFDGRTGAELRSDFAFPGYPGGVSVAAGDPDGDGFAEVIVGAEVSAPHEKAFDGATGAGLGSFFAFDPSFSGGVLVG